MKNGWLIAGAVFGCSAGVGLVACGSSTTSTTSGATTHSTSTTGPSSTSGSTGTATGGSPTTGSTGTAMGGGTTTTTTGGTGGSTCEAASTLFPPKIPDGGGPPDFYCPFSKVDGGSSMYCLSATEECCETTADAGIPSSCQPLTGGTCAAGSTIWQCDDPAECPSATPVCCALGNGTKNPVIEETAGCTDHYASEMTGTKCVATGACTTIVMCTSDAECTGGMTCLPFRKAGNSVGGCQ